MIRSVRLLPVTMLVFALILVRPGGAQDIPSGVNYKKATPEVNAQAQAALQHALANPTDAKTFLGGTISCGPTLWNDLKDSQEQLSKDSTPVTAMLSLPEPLKAEGRGFRTQEQREAFWNSVLAKYPALKTGTVRPARAAEIQYYWTTIPFDIEEPFFAIETTDAVFIANLQNENGIVTLFWLDRVDDLHKLKK